MSEVHDVKETIHLQSIKVSNQNNKSSPRTQNSSFATSLTVRIIATTSHPEQESHHIL